MRPGHRSRVLILLIVCLAMIALILYSSLPERPLSMVNSPLSAILTPLRRASQKVSRTVGDYFSSSRQQGEIRAENERLKEENLALRLAIRANEKAAEEFYKIRDAFKLQEAFPQRQFLAAHILPSPAARYFDLVSIDLGSQSGLGAAEEHAQAVLAASGAVYGRIYTVDYQSSKVLPAYHEGFSISARSESDTAHSFRVRGDFKLKSEYKLVADKIPVNAAIAKGDLVVTSGSGGIYPPGLLIGEVEEIYDAEEAGYREAIIIPAVDFSDCPIVFVLLNESQESQHDDE